MTTFQRLVAATAAAIACASPALAADYTMRLSHQFPPSHASTKNLEQFAKDVSAATGGKVEVQLFGAAQLFKPNQHHAAVAGGKIESALQINFTWGGTIPEMVVTTIPYLMGKEAIKKFPGSEAARLLDAKMEAKGVRNIMWSIDAADGLFTSNKGPLVKPDDFKGVKVRGLSKLFDAGLIAVGAAPSAMPGSEVYQAMQTGVIDAGFTGVDNAYQRRFYEVQKFGVASNILVAYDNLIVSPAWWDKLPEDVRKAIEASARKAEARALHLADGVPQEAVEALRAKGMQVTVLNAAQEKAMADAMQPAVIKAFTESAPDGAKLLEMIRKM